MRELPCAAPVACLALFLALAPGPAAAFAPPGKAARPKPPAGDPFRPGVWRLHGTDPTRPADDLAPLKTLLGRASFVGLGETIHTSGGFYQAKDRVIRYLVSSLGFRVVALETPWVGADRLAAYVESCEGTPEAALGSVFGVWQSAETRDLVAWMCAWNRAHPRPQDRVHFLGFDVQDAYGQMAADAAALRAFLARAGVPADDPRSAGLDACDGVVRSETVVGAERYATCTASLIALDELFRRNATALRRRTSKSDLAWAQLRLSDIRAWEDEVFYGEDDPSFTARDRGMAYALVALRDLRYPKAKTVVWAHNSHLSKANTISSRPSVEYMGSFLAQTLKKDYLAVALASRETEIDWPGQGCGRFDRIGQPGSIEGLLGDLAAGDLLLDLRNPAVLPGLIPAGEQPLGYYRLEVGRDFDLLLYLDRSPKMSPLAWRSCR